MEDERFLEWLCCGDVGVSSKAIAFIMYGLTPETILKSSWTPYPHDAGDFGRCYKLLKILIASPMSVFLLLVKWPVMACSRTSIARSSFVLGFFATTIGSSVLTTISFYKLLLL